MLKKRARVQFFVLSNLIFLVVIQLVVMILFFQNMNNSLNRKINLNDGQTIFSEEKLQLEPNSSVSSSFFIENQSDIDVYFRIYLDRLQGTVIPYLVGTITCGEDTLISAPLAEMKKENITTPMGVLLGEEKKDFLFTIYCKPEANDDEQATYVKFDIKVDVVQVSDNPNGEFDK